MFMTVILTILLVDNSHIYMALPGARHKHLICLTASCLCISSAVQTTMNPQSWSVSHTAFVANFILYASLSYKNIDSNKYEWHLYWLLLQRLTCQYNLLNVFPLSTYGLKCAHFNFTTAFLVWHGRDKSKRFQHFSFPDLASDTSSWASIIICSVAPAFTKVNVEALIQLKWCSMWHWN